MAFGGGSSGSSSIAGSSDAALSGVTGGQYLQYDASVSKWINAAGPTGGGSAALGVVAFDDFSGATDNDKILTMNEWARTQSGSTPAVLFDARQYNFSTPIKLFSGLKLLGATLSPAREYSRGTIFNWQGGAESSLFIFPPEGQTGQSYPADGSPRDITVAYIQMQGGTSTHCIQNTDPQAGGSPWVGRTLWYCQFHGCGFKNFKTVWWGWGTGTSISGQTHFQSIIDTALWLGGSENSIFGDDAISFAANSASWTSTPFIRTNMSKSVIGRCMVTGRKGSSVLRIDGGHNLSVRGLMFDAQSSDPMYGAGLIITGGDGISISHCSFKGVSADPSNATVYMGAAGNKGWIHIGGGSQITISDNMFRREGSQAPATSYPLVHVTDGVGDGQVRWGYNMYSGYGGAQAVVQQQVSNKVTALTDPTLTVAVGG